MGSRICGAALFRDFLVCLVVGSKVGSWAAADRASGDIQGIWCKRCPACLGGS